MISWKYFCLALSLYQMALPPNSLSSLHQIFRWLLHFNNMPLISSLLFQPLSNVIALNCIKRESFNFLEFCFELTLHVLGLALKYLLLQSISTVLEYFLNMYWLFGWSLLMGPHTNNDHPAKKHFYQSLQKHEATSFCSGIGKNKQNPHIAWTTSKLKISIYWFDPPSKTTIAKVLKNFHWLVV